MVSFRKKVSTVHKKFRSEWLIFLLIFIACIYSYQDWGWNQYSRLALLHSIYSEQTLSIDKYESMTGDKSKYNDHFYSDKAPGVAILGLPSFFIGAEITKAAGIEVDSSTGWLITGWITTALTAGLLTALGGTAIFAVLRKLTGNAPAFITTMGLFLGSLPFAYSNKLFSHGVTLGLLAVALWATLRSLELKKGRYAILAGLQAGFAFISEFPMLIAAFVLGCLYFGKQWKLGIYYTIGFLVPCLLLAAHNYLIFGSFFEVGYSHVQGFEAMQSAFGYSYPKFSVLYSILFSEHRGLFFWSPIIILGIAGFSALFKSSKKLAISSAVVFVVYVLLASSYEYWDGGFSFGPRHLSVVIPFVALPIAFGVKRHPRLGTLFALISIFLTGLATLIDGQPPNGFLHPITEFYIPTFLNGQVQNNLGQLIGLNGAWSLVPLIFIALILLNFLFQKLKFSSGSKQNLWQIFDAHSFVQLNNKHSSKKQRPLSFFYPCLLLLLAYALYLRLYQLPYMEFKGDEFTALSLAYKNIHQSWALVGSHSSLGLFHPAFFVYVLSIPVLFTTNPIAITAFIVILNLIGIALLYFFVRRNFSNDISLWVTTLFASTPWAIILSRKIWNPDIIFPFLVLFLILFSFYLKNRRQWALYASWIAFLLITQIHLSTWFLLPALVLFFFFYRIRIRIRDALIGIACFFIIYLPYLYFFLVKNTEDLWQILQSRGGELGVGNLIHSLSWAFGTSTGFHFDFLLGGDGYALFLQEHPFISFVTEIFHLYIIFAFISFSFFLIWGFRQVTKFPKVHKAPVGDQILNLLLLFFVTINIMYFLFNIPGYAHYYLISYPTLSLLVVLFAKKIQVWFPQAAVWIRLFLLCIIVANLKFTTDFYNFVVTQPDKITGDYGVPYIINKQEWADRIKTEIQQIDLSVGEQP